MRCLPAMSAPAQRPRPLRGRRGVRAAPPHVPHPCALWPYFVCPPGHRRRRLTKWTGLHCARGCARPPIAYGRSLRLGGRAWACGAVAPQPATWGGVASGAWQHEGHSDLQGLWCPVRRSDQQGALARRAGPSRFRVVAAPSALARPSPRRSPVMASVQPGSVVVLTMSSNCY